MIQLINFISLNTIQFLIHYLYKIHHQETLKFEGDTFKGSISNENGVIELSREEYSFPLGLSAFLGFLQLFLILFLLGNFILKISYSIGE